MNVNIILIAFSLLFLIMLSSGAIHDWIARFSAKRNGRFMEWTEVVERVSNRQGCLIINNGTPCGRVWWWPESKPPEEYVLAALLTSGSLTKCPLFLRSAKKIKEKFPNVVVVEIREICTGYLR